MKIFYSNYTEINLKTSYKNTSNSQSTEEIYIKSEDSFRFKQNNSMTINPPSNSIHISNLKKKACEYNTMLQFFSKFGDIRRIKYIMNYFS